MTSVIDERQVRPPLRILVAGVGNVLRRDDGFGVVVAQRLRERTDLPAGVEVIEVGIGGISLVQELLGGFDALIVLDAVARDGRPGTLYLLEPAVPAVTDLDEDARHDFLADMHYAEPGRAMMLARALGVLPPRVFVLGCQPARTEELAVGLTPAVARAVHAAEVGIRRLVAELQAEAPCPPSCEGRDSGG